MNFGAGKGLFEMQTPVRGSNWSLLVRARVMLILGMSQGRTNRNKSTAVRVRSGTQAPEAYRGSRREGFRYAQTGAR